MSRDPGAGTGVGGGLHPPTLALTFSYDFFWPVEQDWEVKRTPAPSIYLCLLGAPLGGWGWVG